MKCPSCGTDAEVGAIFCEQCGAQLPGVCEKCGAAVGANAKFCRACGTPAARQSSVSTAVGSDETRKDGTTVAVQFPPVAVGGGERRQLTVMFCDLVESTVLAERVDPEELRDLMQVYQRACRGVIEKYDGHVAQYLGDGLMVYFGWPRAHEDDAARAIHAGLEVARAVSQLKASVPTRARVGIHTGLVVVGETGQGDASIPKAAVGEPPNIAARLQGLAEPNSVVVSERTRALARGLFDYTDLGAHRLKGVSEPVHLFQVLAARAIESWFDAARGANGLTPLVGREQEVELLLHRWMQAKGGEGQVVLVSGEPGVGKSRLIHALREQIADEPYTARRYQCSPYHLNSALYPIIEHLELAAGFAREDTPEQKLDRIEAVLVASAEQIAESAPLFAALLSLPTERYPPLKLSPQKQKKRTLEVLARQVAALAGRKALLMVFEDAHWIDPTSQEALDLLLPRLQALPVLLLITYRPEYTSTWVGQPNVTSLTIRLLGRRQGAELVAKVSGGNTLPAEVLEQIVAHADGVPLFIEELTKSVLESKLLRRTADRYVLDTPLPALAIPTTLRDSLIARLDRLAPVRDVAQMGACIGREFSYELLAALSPLKGARLDDALEQLTNTGLLFRRGMPPDATYTFKHALVQDAAYDSLLKSKRAQLHAHIAQVLERDFFERVANEPELLAHHFTQAGVNDRAVPYWMQAGQRALARVALAEAVGHLATVLKVNALLPASTERDQQELEIRLLLGTAYQSYGGWAAVEVIQTLEPARHLATRLGDDGKLVPILFYIWDYHAIRCEYPSALKIVEELHGLARALADSSVLVVALMCEAAVRLWMGDFKQARQAGNQLLLAYDLEKHGRLVQMCNHDPKSITLHWAGYWLWALGYPDQARQAALNQADVARSLGHAFNLIHSLTLGCWPLVARGETGLARQWIAEASAVGQEHAMSLVTDMMVPSNDGVALIAQGDCEEGYAKLTPAFKVRRGGGAVSLVPFYSMVLGEASLRLKRFDEAERLLDEAVEIINRTGHRMHEAEVHRVLGELHQQQPIPDAKAAEAHFVKAVEVARAQEAKGWELRAAMGLARLWREQGKHREASDVLAPIYNWFTEGFDTQDLKAARELLESLR